MTTVVKKKGDALPALSQVLTDLAKRSAALDAIDTQISQLITRVEDGLREHFSIRISHPIHRDFGGEDYEDLVFGKWDGKWQLLIESGDIGSPDDPAVTPLMSSAREMRAKVFVEGHVEAMIRGAVAQLDEQLAQRRAALETASALAEALDGIPF